MWWHPALGTLCWLQLRSFFRRIRRQLRTPKGIVLALVGLGLFCLWLFGAVVGGLVNHKMGRVFDPATAVNWVPVGLVVYLLLILLTTLGEQSLSFTPAESDILFRAPVTRRHLLMYKLTRQFVALIIPAVFLSFGLNRISRTWPQAVVTGWLMLLFLHLVSVLWAQGLQSVGVRLSGKVRMAILAVLIGGGLAATYWLTRQQLDQFLPSFGASARSATRPTTAGASAQFQSMLMDKAMAVRQQPVIEAALRPLEVFPRIMTAPSFAAVLAPVGMAAAFVAALVAVLVRLDADFLDKAEAVGRRRAQTQLNMRRNGGMKLRVTGTAKRKFAMPRYFGGVGPVVWRQINSALRQSRGVLTTIGILMAVVVMVAGNKSAQSSLYGIAPWACFMLATILRFDFRADLDRMSVLKAWPISPIALAIGQLLTPVLLSGAVAFAGAAALVAYGALSLKWALVGVVAGVAVIGNIVALENAVFLLFPTRGTGGAGDLQHIGRNALLMIGRLLVLGLGLGTAFGVGFLVKYLSGSLMLAAACGGLVVWAELSAMVYVVAAAFRRFDAGRDTPPT